MAVTKSYSNTMLQNLFSGAYIGLSTTQPSVDGTGVTEGGTSDYKKEFDELVERHSRVKQEYEEQAIAAEQDVGRVAQIDYFISTLEELNSPVTEFDEQLWISMVDHVVVHSKEYIRVVYRDGIEK